MNCRARKNVVNTDYPGAGKAANIDSSHHLDHLPKSSILMRFRKTGYIWKTNTFPVFSYAVLLHFILFNFIPFPSIKVKQNQIKQNTNKSQKKRVPQTRSEFIETMFSFSNTAAPCHCKYLCFSIYFNWNFIVLPFPCVLGYRTNHQC